MQLRFILNWVGFMKPPCESHGQEDQEGTEEAEEEVLRQAAAQDVQALPAPFLPVRSFPAVVQAGRKRSLSPRKGLSRSE